MTKRIDIEDKYKWDLTSIYKSSDDWDKDYNTVLELLKTFSNYHNLMDNANTLNDFINLDEKVTRIIYKLYNYAHLNNDGDTSDTKYQEAKGKAKDLFRLYSEETSFVRPLLLQYDYSKIEEYMAVLPSLKDHEKSLKEIYRYKAHTLSDEEEKMLSSLSNVFSNPEDNFGFLTDSDMKFGNITVDGKEVELTESNYGIYRGHKNRQVRKDSFEMIHSTFGKFKNTMASIISGQVEMLTKLASIRKYNSSLEASLFDEEIDPVVYNNLIDTVSNHLDVLYRYYEVKQKMLNLDEFHLYDSYVNVVKENDKKYTFEEAHDLVISAMAVLGKEYTDNLEKAFKERWIDIYPNDYKRSGAYSGGSYDTKPFVLLNFEGRYDDVSTLAHELGHSMHSYLTRTNNPYETGDYKIFVAEVASTVNELLLAKYMLKNSSDAKERLSILSDLMGLYKGTIYRQVMFAEFERDIHRAKETGKILTNDLLCDMYYKLNQKYFGDKVVVDELIKYEWMRIPHFYYDFYVYKYAIGLSCASKIASDILNNKENAKENYIKFLSSGSQKPPMELLRDTGCDLTKSEVVESAINMFSELLDDFVATYKEVEEGNIDGQERLLRGTRG